MPHLPQEPGADHQRGAPEDPVERWGRRTGRALGYIFVALLILNLFTRWFF